MNGSDADLFKWIMRIVVIVVVFAGVPFFISAVASNYTRQADTVLGADSAVVDQYSSVSSGQISILTADDVIALDKTKMMLSGEWHDFETDGHLLAFHEDGSYLEKFDAKQPNFGTWTVSASSTSEASILADSASADKDGGSSNGGSSDGNSAEGGSGSSPSMNVYYIQTTGLDDGRQGQSDQYEVMQVDDDKLILFSLTDKSMLYFSRATSTTSF